MSTTIWSGSGSDPTTASGPSSIPRPHLEFFAAGLELGSSVKGGKDSDDFTEVRSRKATKARRVLVGTKNDCSTLRPGTRVIQRDYYIGGLDKSTTDVGLKDYLTSRGMTCSMCVRLDATGSASASFHVKILKSDLDAMWNPANWPERVRVRAWKPRPRRTHETRSD